MPKRERSRRTTALDVLTARLDKATRPCIAVAVQLAGFILMRCPSGCPRCAALQAEVDAAAPERERARQEYETRNPKKAVPKPAPDDDLEGA